MSLRSGPGWDKQNPNVLLLKCDVVLGRSGKFREKTCPAGRALPLYLLDLNYKTSALGCRAGRAFNSAEAGDGFGMPARLHAQHFLGIRRRSISSSCIKKERIIFLTPRRESQGVTGLILSPPFFCSRAVRRESWIGICGWPRIFSLEREGLRPRCPRRSRRPLYFWLRR